MLINNRLIVLAINLLLYFPVLATDVNEEKDPCFFKLTLQDSRNMYIVGSPHVVKIEDLLASPALEEFTRIATQERPFLFTEHPVDNKHAFKILEENKPALNMGSPLEVGSEYKSIMSEKVYFEPHHLSEYTISNILEIQPWLAAPILSSHSGMLFYPIFSGTEYNLETDEKWTTHWAGMGYLEGPNHYKILEDTSVMDTFHNKQWIKSSLKKILWIKSITQDLEKEAQDELELMVLEQEKVLALQEVNESIKFIKTNFRNKGWTVVNSSSVDIPRSAIGRNELWANVIASRLEETTIEEEPNPYLIIVGNGHLSGIGQGNSFLSFLMMKLKIQKIERFINFTKSWKDISS